MSNKNLSQAKKAKQDEFYTQYPDIENEVKAYINYNPDVFKNKTVFCPCDDPDKSNFTKYFSDNFKKLGLKKLISTCYIKDNFGKKLVKTDSGITHDILDGDGDFRSEEITKLRDETDIICTNPPFSLFREFLAWIMEGNKQFLIIGNVNCITYKEVFPLIRDNKVWIGCRMNKRINGKNMAFRVPSNYPMLGTEVFIGDDGNKYISVAGTGWITNLDHGNRHEPLSLMTMADNVKFSKHKEIRNHEYQKYDNYDAIEVPFTDAIPEDYNGKMGVPITFLNKYCPEQFKIIGGFNNSDISNKEEDGYVLSLNTPTIIGGKEKMWNGPVVNKTPKYYRVIIQKKV